MTRTHADNLEDAIIALLDAVDHDDVQEVGGEPLAEAIHKALVAMPELRKHYNDPIEAPDA